jgi:hypothetical protein
MQSSSLFPEAGASDHNPIGSEAKPDSDSLARAAIDAEVAKFAVFQPDHCERE